jgi:hypothetical protein
MIAIDETYWPLVVFRFSGDVSMAELEAYLKRQEEMTARQERTASLVLTENLKMWETPVLRQQAQWVKEHYDVLQRLSLGAAQVIRSPVIRGMLKAVLWLQPMPQPHVVTATVEEALAWLKLKMRAANVAVELPATENLKMR